MTQDKLSYLQQKNLTPADELRQLLSELENRQPNLKRFDATQALNVLRDLDLVYDLFQQLAQTNLDLTSEQARFTATQSYYRRHVKTWLQALGGVEALVTHRPKPTPSPTARWWWYINQEVTAQQKAFLQRTAIIGGIIMLMFGGVVLIFKTILAPDPEVLALFQAQEDIFSEIDIGNYDLALTIADKSLQEIKADDTSLLLTKGILHELLAQPAEAEQTYQQTKVIFEDMTRFLVSRAQLYLRVGELEKAEVDAKNAVDLNEKSAVGWVLLAQSLELQGKEFEAMLTYEKAGEVALETDHSEIVIMARLALARMSPAQPGMLYEEDNKAQEIAE